MELRYKYRFNFFLYINEVIIIVICFFLSHIILNKFSKDVLSLNDLWMLPVLIIGWYFTSRSTKHSDNINSQSLASNLYKITNGIIVQGVLVVFYFFTQHQTFNTNRFLLIYVVLLSCLIPLENVLYEKILFYFHKK